MSLFVGTLVALTASAITAVVKKSEKACPTCPDGIHVNNC